MKTHDEHAIVASVHGIDGYVAAIEGGELAAAGFGALHSITSSACNTSDCGKVMRDFLADDEVDLN